MGNIKNKIRIKKLLEKEDLTTGEVMSKLKNLKSISGKKSNGQKKLKRSNKYDVPTMNQLGNVMRCVGTKKGFCNVSNQVIWTLKEE